ncbi:MAG TPA: hypothetical protein VF148_13915 [Acidimicrobiia bacterium]
MTTSARYPGGARAQPGSPRAKAVVAGAVIALATAIAGTALLAGLATGSSIEAPDQPVVPVTQPAERNSPLSSGATYD